MIKILLYFVLFGLNFVTVHTAINSTDMDFVQRQELEECERLCLSAIINEQKKGYLRKSAWYLNRAIDLSKEYSNGNVSNKDIVDKLNNAVNQAALNFIQARIKVVSIEEINEYFSKKVPPVDGENYVDFGAYLKNNKVVCHTEDVRNAMIECYLKQYDNSRWCLIM